MNYFLATVCQMKIIVAILNLIYSKWNANSQLLNNNKQTKEKAAQKTQVAYNQS